MRSAFDYSHIRILYTRRDSIHVFTGQRRHYHATSDIITEIVSNFGHVTTKNILRRPSVLPPPETCGMRAQRRG